VLRDHVPADAAVDAVLEQHGFVGGARAAHVTVAAVRLRTAPNLQNKHDFACSSEIQRLGGRLPYLTAIKIE